MDKNAAKPCFILTVILLTLLVCCPFQADATLKTGAVNDFSELESYINREIIKYKVPGLSIAIFDDEDIIYTKGFGVKDITVKNPVDEDTMFITASISKTVTAYAALILVDRGLMSLDEPLTHYLKTDYLPASKSADKITLRMILNHTSGLSNDSTGKDRKIYFNPGAYFSYSSAGFCYLQRVIEDITDMPFNNFVTTEIFVPLAMDSSSFSYEEMFLPNMAYGHYSGKTIHRQQLRKVTANASYSLLSTPSDISKFAMEILDSDLLSSEINTQMREPSSKWLSKVSWGLGIGIVTRPGGDLLWHWGNTITYQNMMLINPQSKSGVIVMTNSSNGLKLACNLAVKVANDYLINDDNGLPEATFNFLNN